MPDRTLILVKPDAFERGLTGEVIARFERKGLRLVALKLMQVDERARRDATTPSTRKAVLRRAGRVHHARRRWSRWCSRATSAVKAARQVIGATNPVEAAPGSIRGDFATEVTFNLVHGSDSAESAEREIGICVPRALNPPARPRLALAAARAILEQLGIPFEVRSPASRS